MVLKEFKVPKKYIKMVAEIIASVDQNQNGCVHIKEFKNALAEA